MSKLLFTGGVQSQFFTAIFISPDGNDTTGDGTFNLPWQSFTKARDELEASSEKDTVYLFSGTYTEPVTVTLNANDAGQSWLAYPGATVVVDGDQSNQDVFVLAAGADNVTFRGLTFDNLSLPGNCTNGIVSTSTISNMTVDGVVYNGAHELFEVCESGVELPAFFVATDGSDSNSGTSEAEPLLTLSAARDKMRSDATRSRVYIRGGTYTLSSAVSLSSSDNNTEWLAYPGETPTIDGNGNTIELFDCGSADGVKWQGLTFTNDQSSTKIYAIDLDNCDAGVVLDCTFQTMHSGIRIRNGSTTTKVLECTFTDIQGSQNAADLTGDAIRMEDSVVGVEIAGCDFSNSFQTLTSSGFGRAMLSQRNCQNVTVEYNYVTGCGGSFMNFGNPPTASTKHDNFNIRYNKFEDCCTHIKDGAPIYVNDRPNLDRTVTLNINDNWIQNVGWTTSSTDLIWLNGIYLDDSAGNWDVFNNVVINARSVSVHNHGGPGNSFTNNIMLVETTDPQLTGSAVSSWVYPKFYENQGDSTYGDGSPMNTTWDRNIMISVSPTTGEISSYGNENWWNENSSSAPGYEVPDSIDRNTKYQNIPAWSAASESNPDNTDPEFNDIANFDFTLAVLPGTGFTHIAGVTDGGTFTWSSPANNTDSGYSRGDYI